VLLLLLLLLLSLHTQLQPSSPGPISGLLQHRFHCC
jgi:hypothetical protein